MATTYLLDELRAKLCRHGQEHVLRWWDELGDHERVALVEQLVGRQDPDSEPVSGIDVDELQQLYARRDEKSALPSLERIAALPRPADDASALERYRQQGEAAFRSRQVASRRFRN